MKPIAGIVKVRADRIVIGDIVEPFGMVTSVVIGHHERVKLRTKLGGTRRLEASCICYVFRTVVPMTKEGARQELDRMLSDLQDTLDRLDAMTDAATAAVDAAARYLKAAHDERDHYAECKELLDGARVNGVVSFPVKWVAP